MELLENLFIEELSEIQSETLKLKIVALKNLFDTRNKEEKSFISIKQDLSKKYENKYIPIYDERLKILEGTGEVKSEEIMDQAKLINVDTLCINEEKGIPGFWMKAISNCYIYQDIVNPKDKEVLNFLHDVRVIFLENNNFSIKFHFHKNEYFDHEVLSKTCIHSVSNPKEILEVKGTKIKWKSKNLNPSLQIKTLKKSKKQNIQESKFMKVPSFFEIFQDFNKDSVDIIDEETEDAPIKEVTELQREYDDMIFLKDDFIPYAFEYYLGIKDNESDDDNLDCHNIIQEIEIEKPINKV